MKPKRMTRDEVLAEHAAHVLQLREAYLNHLIERWKEAHLQQIVRLHAAAPPKKEEAA